VAEHGRKKRGVQVDLFSGPGRRSGPPAGEEPRAFTVSEIVGLVRQALEDRYREVLVTGELSGLTVASSGHAYFSLKDDRAVLPAVMFRMSLMRLRQGLPPEGTAVLARGRLTLFEARGRFQLLVEELVPTGAGALELRFRELKARLEAEGLFDPARRRPLPRIPRRVGVVTSPTGAALRDILRVLRRRNPALPVLLAPTRVQGEGAALEIARAVDRLGDGRRCDVLIVGRGGGSAEDLWAFNEEAVVRAVARSRVPVISAVGHEVDVVLSDLAADLRAPTPSAAAELVTPDREGLEALLRAPLLEARRLLLARLVRAHRELLETGQELRDPRLALAAHRLRLDESSRQLAAAARRRLGEAHRRLTDLRLRLAAREPRARLAADRARLEELGGRLRASARSSLGQRRFGLLATQAALTAHSPLAVLARGYSLALDADGRAVRAWDQVAPGDGLRLRLHRGELSVRVERTHPPPDEDPGEPRP